LHIWSSKAEAVHDSRIGTAKINGSAIQSKVGIYQHGVGGGLPKTNKPTFGSVTLYNLTLIT